MKCNVCGTPVNVGEFCPECGTKCDGVLPCNGSSGVVAQPQQQYGWSDNMRFSNYSPYYQRAFAEIEASGGAKSGGFNICAFFFGSLWAFAKGAWLSALVTILICAVTSGIASPVIWILYGIRGNRIVYNAKILKKQVIF